MAAKLEIPQKPTIDAKQAYKAAVEYFRVFYPSAYVPSLEEVELSDDGKYWLITLGFEEPKKASNPLAALQPPRARFKVFKVDSNTGAVLAMKIRSLE